MADLRVGIKSSFQLQFVVYFKDLPNYGTKNLAFAKLTLFPFPRYGNFKFFVGFRISKDVHTLIYC